MTLEEAEAIIKEAAEMREKWGKHFTGQEMGVENILDALLIVHKEYSEASKEALAKANRQLGMSKAREIQRTKERDEAREKLKENVTTFEK